MAEVEAAQRAQGMNGECLGIEGASDDPTR
jgi:hypothetical protein